MLILKRRKLSLRYPCGRSSLHDLLAAPGSAGVFGIAKAARFLVVQAVFLCRRQAPISAVKSLLGSSSRRRSCLGLGYFLSWILSAGSPLHSISAHSFSCGAYLLFCFVLPCLRFDLPSLSASCSKGNRILCSNCRYSWVTDSNYCRGSHCVPQ
jgi:hypothetical protein